MQTLDPRPVIEPAGWYFINTMLTAAGRKKVSDFYDCVVADQESKNVFGKTYSVKDFIEDIEVTSGDNCLHPVCERDGFYEALIEGVDYVLEFKSEEAYRLEKLANDLNELHNVMQSEMQRLGW